MNTVKNFTTIHNPLNQIDVLEVVIDLSNKVCIPNIIEDLNLSVFNVITGANESITLTSIFHVNVNVDLMGKNVIQIYTGITINVDVSVKKSCM